MRHFGYLRLEELDDRSQTITKLTSTCTGLRVGPTTTGFGRATPQASPRYLAADDERHNGNLLYTTAISQYSQDAARNILV